MIAAPDASFPLMVVQFSHFPRKDMVVLLHGRARCLVLVPGAGLGASPGGAGWRRGSWGPSGRGAGAVACPGAGLLMVINLVGSEC